MLSRLFLLACISFATLYPVFHFVNFRATYARSFYQFNFGLSAVFGGMAAFSLFFTSLSGFARQASVVWVFVLLGVAALFWGKEKWNKWIFLLPALAGVVAFQSVQEGFFKQSGSPVFGEILGALILCAAVFSTTLGHWYLNVRAMPIQLLEKAVNLFGLLLLIRGVWDIFGVFFQTVVYQGDTLPVHAFLQTLDGIFLLVGFLFGVLFPLGLVFFTRKTLALESTTSATGILYVALISVLVGDFPFRYFLYKYGLIF